MYHKALVACLVCTTFLTGCASSLTDRLDRANSSILASANGPSPTVQEWLDDHPVVRTTAYCVGFAVLTAGVAALIVLLLVTNDRN